MKKIVKLVLVFLLAVSLFGCKEQKQEVFNIGICQLVTHDALDAATNGFKQALIDKLGQDKVSFDYQNAAGDPNTCNSIMSSFVSKKVDLIMANATPALEAAYNATSSIPILGTSITEYGVALGIKDFNGVTNTNVSGTSDLAPLNEQAQMIIDFFPSVKKVGILYCSSEANSAYQVQVVSSFLKEKGVEVEEFKFTDSSDISLVTASACAACEVLYVPTDNTAASCAETIGNIVLQNKKPLFAGEANICKICGVATLSINYYDLGYKTGEMAAKILLGEAKIASMPIEYAPAKKYFNKDVCDLLGIIVPEGYETL